MTHFSYNTKPLYHNFLLLDLKKKKEKKNNNNIKLEHAFLSSLAHTFKQVVWGGFFFSVRHI